MKSKNVVKSYVHIRPIFSCPVTYADRNNREYFSGNEGKDLQLQNFFTANKKQYTVAMYVML